MRSFFFILLLIGNSALGQTGAPGSPFPDSVQFQLKTQAATADAGFGGEWQAGKATEKISNPGGGSKSRGGNCLLIYRFSVKTLHNYTENGVLGMAIMPDFTIFNAEGRPMKAVAYFYDNYGELLPDMNGQYSTVGGKVSSSANFRPAYHQTLYNSRPQSDLYVFIPYSEISNYSGKYWFKVFIWDGQDKNASSVYESEFYSFTITY